MASLLCALLLTASWSIALKDWASSPVSIVLSDIEKKTFTQLSTDEERQPFIDAFWSSPNPDSTTRANEFKGDET